MDLRLRGHLKATWHIPRFTTGAPYTIADPLLEGHSRATCGPLKLTISAPYAIADLYLTVGSKATWQLPRLTTGAPCGFTSQGALESHRTNSVLHPFHSIATSQPPKRTIGAICAIAEPRLRYPSRPHEERSSDLKLFSTRLVV